MTREQLFDVEELAQAAHRGKLAAIGTLAASINHEIKNPLYIIQGLAQGYQANIDEGIFKNSNQMAEKALEILKKTEAHATRAMEIMKSFAVFAKQSVNEISKTETVDLNVVFNNVLPLVRHELDLEKINLVQNIPDKIMAVKADRGHLEEIFFNLIVNACQAIKLAPVIASANDLSSPKSFIGDPLDSRLRGNDSLKKGRIEIFAVQHNGTVNVTIQDNGPGIPQSRLKQVFEPFYTTKEEGTGLGLYITKQLIEKNGGCISVKSKPGAGTTFLLEFKR